MVLNARLATKAPAGVSSAIRRGGRRSVTKQPVPDRLTQPIVGEKSGPNPDQLAFLKTDTIGNGGLLSRSELKLFP